MKTILILLLLITSKCFAQSALEVCQRAFIEISIKVDSLRQSNQDLRNKVISAKRLDTANQKAIKHLSNQVIEQDSIIELYKNKDAKMEIPPLIKWDGFYPNFIIGYDFTPESVIVPIIKVLKFSISAEFVFKVLDRIKLVIEPVLPFDDKFRIQGKIGYRLF